MIMRWLTAIVIMIATIVLRKHAGFAGLGKELRRRLNLAFAILVGGYILIAIVRLVIQPPTSDQLGTLAAVAAVLGLVWLALRVALGLAHLRR